MPRFFSFIASHLKRMLIYIESKILLDEENEDEKEALLTLAPKVITEEKELKKIKPYLENLKKALSTKGINNIAVTGSYGSGKSTILKTFQFFNPEYEYLNISLASFKDNKEHKTKRDSKKAGFDNIDPIEDLTCEEQKVIENNEETKGIENNEDFERRLEVSILQQMFYHVKPSDIPDSRFKRIINLSDTKLFLKVSIFSLWLISVLILFKFDYINKLDPLSWSSKLDVDWFTLILLIVFFIGVGLFIKSMVRLLSNSKINKLNIKGELEFGEKVDKSVFNQHLEEILYFFERTKFNVVIIEDVDRFNSTDIFTKLREINILINNSNPINREVKFIYAIRDEMFSDKSERVKFFEFIIPVIPFINPSNAGEQLTKLLVAAQLEGVLSNEFTDDVITFIDDIDMRLLINIFHEYQIYKENLGPDLGQDNLFAIIVYKNMYPEDFGKLPKRDGELYRFFSNRNKYIESLIKNINTKITSIDSEIKSIENEISRPVKELRAIYINKLVSKLSNFYCFYHKKDFSISEALEDEYFNDIKDSKNIFFKQWTLQRYQSNQYYLSEETASGITFSKVEIEVSPISTYNQRLNNLLSKKNDDINKLKRKRESLKYEISEVESLSIKEIFEKVEIDKYLETFKNNLLIRNLLLNGYINENYNDFITLFHEVNLTKEDFSFERKVKSGQGTSFEYRLNKIENLLKKLNDKYFRREVILNFDVLNFLMENRLKFSGKHDNFFRLLGTGSVKTSDFILGFIKTGPKDLEFFMKDLVKYNQGFWDYLKNKSELPDEEIRKTLLLIFEHADIKDISRFTDIDSLAFYLEEQVDVFEFSSKLNDIGSFKQFIHEKDLLFKQLDIANDNSMELFDFIYEGNNYEINEHNINVILKTRENNFDDSKLYSAYYSTILKTENKNLLEYLSINIENYIEEVLLKLPDNKDEDEITVVDILNNETVSLILKEQFIISQTKLINSLDKIVEIGTKEMLLNNKKVIPNWENVFNYYDALEEKSINQILIDFLNAESVYMSLSEIKLDFKGDYEEEFYDDFSYKLIYSDNLDSEAYFSLLKSVPYVYTDIDFGKLDKVKTDWMVTNIFLTLTIENFNGIKDFFKNLHIKLLEVNESEFVNKFKDFNLDPDDWYLLFNSSVFSLDNKIKIISELDDSVIVENKELADIVCFVLPTDKYISLRSEVLLEMFRSNSSVEKRLGLLLLHMGNLNDSQIQKLTELLGEDYARVFVKQNKPVFPNNKLHFTFFEKLREKNLIIRQEHIGKTDEIRVIAKYL